MILAGDCREVTRAGEPFGPTDGGSWSTPGSVPRVKGILCMGTIPAGVRQAGRPAAKGRPAVWAASTFRCTELYAYPERVGPPFLPAELDESVSSEGGGGPRLW